MRPSRARQTAAVKPASLDRRGPTAEPREALQGRGPRQSALAPPPAPPFIARDRGACAALAASHSSPSGSTGGGGGGGAAAAGLQRAAALMLEVRACAGVNAPTSLPARESEACRARLPCLLAVASHGGGELEHAP